MLLNIVILMCFQTLAWTDNHISRSLLSRFRFYQGNHALHNKLPPLLIYCLLIILDAWERKTDR